VTLDEPEMILSATRIVGRPTTYGSGRSLPEDGRHGEKQNVTERD